MPLQLLIPTQDANPIEWFLHQFVLARQIEIYDAMQLGGKWEVWAQVELAFAFKSHNVPVAREQPIFANEDQRIDLWLPNNLPPQRGLTLIGRTSNEDVAAFQARIMDNADRIGAWLAETTPTPCHLYTAALTTVMNDLDFGESTRLNQPAYYVIVNTIVMGNVYLIFSRHDH